MIIELHSSDVRYIRRLLEWESQRHIQMASRAAKIAKSLETQLKESRGIEND